MRIAEIEAGSVEPRSQSVVSVIVMHDPDSEFRARLKRVGGQVGRVILVDNHSAPSIRAELRRLASASVDLIENDRNEGIGRALNQGMVRASALGASWVLTLDQDSLVDPDLMEGLRSVYARYPAQDRIGIIQSNARSRDSGHVFVRCRESAPSFIEAKTVITSGSLVALRAYSAVGPFREDFFIEGVDLKYCLRLRRHGFKILLSCRPLMVHAAGMMRERRLFRRAVVVANHAPWRYYYMSRNLSRIMAMYFRFEPLWVVTAAVNFAKSLVKLMLFEDRRREKIRYVGAGIRDAITGRDAHPASLLRP